MNISPAHQLKQHRFGKFYSISFRCLSKSEVPEETCWRSMTTKPKVLSLDQTIVSNIMNCWIILEVLNYLGCSPAIWQIDVMNILKNSWKQLYRSELQTKTKQFLGKAFRKPVRKPVRKLWASITKNWFLHKHFPEDFSAIT